MRFRSFLLFCLAGTAGCADTADLPDQGPSRHTRWINDAGLFEPGFGEVSFIARDGNHLTARIYRGTRFDPAQGPVWFVLHGADRDVERYIRAGAPVAERYDALTIAIHFSTTAYPTGDDYTLGLGQPAGYQADGPWRAPQDMLYAELEYVFDLVCKSLNGRQEGYYVFGHSAGAQFTHRLLTFLPDPRVLGAVAANAGWYTLPTSADPSVHTMPYGLIGGPVDAEALARLFEAPFTVLLGQNDTSSSANDDLVRGTPQAEAQGANRLERGRHYFAVGRAEAAALDTPFRWRLAVVPGAGHDAARVIASAGFFTFEPGVEPCTATAAADATGLAITEILADPPDGAAGDANGDGVRDPADDEFVEMVNGGPGPICLAGWMLGDAESADRHVFPLGAALAPGQHVIVFGGGVPTGRFSEAQVQWSAHGLSLQNAGDVLTLRSADGEIVERVSWGDCAGAPCAAQHRPGLPSP